MGGGRGEGGMGLLLRMHLIDDCSVSLRSIFNLSPSFTRTWVGTMESCVLSTSWVDFARSRKEMLRSVPRPLAYLA